MSEKHFLKLINKDNAIMTEQSQKNKHEHNTCALMVNFCTRNQPEPDRLLFVVIHSLLIM